MKMPEKIYLLDYNDAMVTPLEGDTTYVREDTFIEKAADYIKKDMLDNLAFQGRLHRIEIIDGIIEKFIKAMKGE